MGESTHSPSHSISHSSRAEEDRHQTNTCASLLMQASLVFTMAAAVVMLCTLAESLDAPDPVALFLWQRLLPEGAAVPSNGPTFTVSVNTNLVVELRQNTTTSIAYIRGVNVTNGVVMWSFISPCQKVANFVQHLGDGASFVLGCTDRMFVYKVTNAALVSEVNLPSGTQFNPIHQATVKDGMRRFTTLYPRRYLVLSVVNNSKPLSLSYGSVVYDIQAGAIQTTPGLISCAPVKGSVNRVVELLTESGEHGYTQVCAYQQVMYVPWLSNATKPTWTYNNSFAAGYLATMYSSGASLANVALVYTSTANGGTQHVIGFQVLETDGSVPSWDYEVPVNISSIIAIASVGERIVVLSANAVFTLLNGTLQWVQYAPRNDLLPTIVTDTLLGANLVVMSSITLKTINFATGALINQQPIDNTLGWPVYTTVTVIQSQQLPFDSNTPVPAPVGTPRLILYSSAYLQIADVAHGNMTQVISLPMYGGVPASPMVVVGRVFPASPTESILLVQSSVGLAAVLLTVSWNIQDALYMGQQGPVVFVNSVEGNAAALDRNGNIIWEHLSPFNVQAGSPFPFVNNIMLDIVASSAVAAYNTYTGSLFTTLLIPSDCRDNVTLPSPSIQRFTPDSTLSNVYFTAGLTCLFRVSSSLELASFPVPLAFTNPPVVDDDNSLVYLFTANEVYAVSTVTGATLGRIFTTTFTIFYLIPSSTLSSSQNLGKGLNPLLYVINEQGVTALNVLDLQNTYVWNLPLPGVVSFEFSNNTLFVVSTTQGLCRISLDVAVSSAQRVEWCVNANTIGAAAGSLSNLQFSANGIVFLAANNQLLSVDSNTGRPRWKLGPTTLADTNCGQLLYDGGLQLLFVSCEASIQVLDAAHLGYPLFFVSTQVAMSMFYFPGTLFLGVTNQFVGVSGINIPLMVTNRGASPVEPMWPTEPPAIETLPPNFVPIPEVAPVPSAYPTTNEYPDIAALVSIQADPSGTTNTVASSAFNDNLFPGGIFMSPHIDEATGQCVVSQFDSDRVSKVWITPINLTGCVCDVSISRIVGNMLGNGQFVFLCGSTLFSFDGASGKALWNSTGTPHAFNDFVAWQPFPASGILNFVVIGITSRNVVAFDALTGAGVALLPINTNIANAQFPLITIQLYYPPSTNNRFAYVVLSGIAVQVIQLGPNRTNFATTLLVQGASNPCDGASSIQYAVPVQAQYESREYYDCNSAYFACHSGSMVNHLSLFRIALNSTNVTTAVQTVANVGHTAQAPTLLNLMVERPDGSGGAVHLYLVTDLLLYSINGISGSISWVTDGPFQPMMAVQGGLLLVAGQGQSFSGAMPAIAFDKGTGIPQWNVSVGAPASFIVGQERFATAMISNHVMVLGAGGVYGVNISTGTIVWVSHQFNQGIVKSLNIVQNSALYTMPQDPTNSAVNLVTAAYYATAQTILVVSAMPSSHALLPRVMVSSSWDSYPITTATGVSTLGIVSAAPAVLGGTQVALTNFASWTKYAHDVLAVFTRPITAGGATITVAFVFSNFYVTLYNAANGQQLSRFFYVDACPALGMSPMISTIQFQEIGPFDVFSDAYCVYRVDPQGRALEATVLSAMGVLVFTSPITIANDNNTAVFSSSTGAISAVSIATMQVMWVNDLGQYLLGAPPTSLSIPYYPSTTALASQQLLALSGTGVNSYSLSDGSLLWTFPVNGVEELVTTSDGCIVVMNQTQLMKLSLKVTSDPSFNRVLWQSSAPSIYSTFGATCLAQATGSNLIIAVVSNAFAVDLQTGRIVWVNTIKSFESCNSISFIADLTATGVPAPMMITTGLDGCRIFSVSSGSVLYAISTEDPPVNIQLHNGNVVFDLLGNIEVVSLPFPQSVAFPPDATYAAAPLIPSGYVYNLSLPPVSSLAAPPASPLPIPLTTWTFQLAEPVPPMKRVFVAASGASGKDLLFQLVTGQETTGTVSFINIVNAVSGVLENTKDMTSECSPTWMGQLSDIYAGVVCSATQQFSIMNLAQTDPVIVSPVVSNPQPGRAGSTIMHDLTLQIPDYHLGCVLINSGVSLTCLHMNPLDGMKFATVSYTMSCPGNTGMADPPFYHQNLQLLIGTCSNTTTVLLLAVEASTGAFSWQSTFGNATVSIAKVFLSQLSYGAVQLVSSAVGNYGPNVYVQTFLMSNGGVMPGPGVFNLQPTDDNAVLKLLIAENSANVLESVLIIITSAAAYAFSMQSGNSNWVLKPILMGTWSSVATALIPDPNTPSNTLLYLMPQDDFIISLDPISGNIIYQSSYVGPVDFSIAVEIINDGANYGILFTMEYSVVYIDVATNQIVYANLGYSAQYALVRVMTVVTPTGDFMLDIPIAGGTIVQIVANVTGTVALGANQFAVVVDPLTGYEYVMATDGPITGLADYNGVYRWGTQLPPIPSNDPTSIDPQVFSVGQPGDGILFRSMLPRYFVGFSLQAGELLYAGILPLCAAEGGNVVNYQAVSTVDRTNNMIYVSAGNPCLYGINGITGDVTFTQLASNTPLQGFVKITASCIVTIDTFGRLICFQRGVSLTGATPKWTYKIGYAVNTINLNMVSEATGLLVVNVANSLYCFAESTGVLAWKLDLGSHLVFSIGGNSTIFASSWEATYAIALDPAAPKRILWSTSTTTIFGAPYSAVYSSISPLPTPAVTPVGTVLVVYGSSLVSLTTDTGAVVFTTSEFGGTCTRLLYNGDADPLNRVAFLTCGTLSLISVVDGTVFASLNQPLAMRATAANLMLNEQKLVFATGNGLVQILPLPSYILKLAPVLVPLHTAPPQFFTLPPNFAPQGLFTPIPALPPGATLPILGCVLNIEALYGDLVTCVNKALKQSYAGQNPNAMACQSLAETTAPCVASWILDVLPSCPASLIYLNNVLQSFNQSLAFNYCSNPARCADGATGAHAICELVNAAAGRTGGATFAPQQVLPGPANQLPTFTIPSNTAGPTTKSPVATTTSAPTSGPATATSAPASTATSAPASTAVPATSTVIPSTTTAAPAATTPVPASAQQYMFRCSLPTGQTTVPAQFALTVATFLGLPDVSITIIQPASISADSRSTHDTFAVASTIFSFYFIGDNAAERSTALETRIVANPAAVAAALGLQSIAAVPLTPAPQGSPASGLGGGAVAGIIFGVLIAGAVIGFIVYRQLQRRSRRYASTLPASMIQEEGGTASPISSGAEMSSLVVAKDTQGPVYSSL